MPKSVEPTKPRLFKALKEEGKKKLGKLIGQRLTDIELDPKKKLDFKNPQNIERKYSPSDKMRDIPGVGNPNRKRRNILDSIKSTVDRGVNEYREGRNAYYQAMENIGNLAKRK